MSTFEHAPLPEQDLSSIVELTGDLWEEMRGSRLFVTGGTGFFGRWMLESFLKANDNLGLQAEAFVLTRAPRRFAETAGHIARHPAIRLLDGDVRSFAYPSADCTHVIHMATETGVEASPLASFRTAVEGTTRVLAFAAKTGAKKLLLTSSGAVYGPQPPDCEHLSEDYAGAPRPEEASAGYGHGKRAAEFLCACAATETGLQAKIARCFAFVGPLLPLDANFAIGNFIRDALYGDRIEVTGDGTPRRSYLYMADLAVWLWTILCRGESARPYNVGSETDVSIAELADLVVKALRPGLPVRVARRPATGTKPLRYVPATARAARELGLSVHVPLEDAIIRTARWYAGGVTPAED